MNTQSEAMRDSSVEPLLEAPATSQPRPLYWSIQRELWENRWTYLAPIAVAGLFLLGFLISSAHLPATMRGLVTLTPAQQREKMVLPYDFSAGLMMLTMMLIGAFYCLSAFQGERRDRSILFWKSVPVSDATTVLSKAVIPLLLLPLVTSAVTVALQWLMLLWSSLILLASGVKLSLLWTQISLLQMSILLLYHLFTVHALWPAPLYGWLLMVSAWAKRAAFLWAVLPLVAIAFVEKIAFNTTHFLALIGTRVTGSGSEAIAEPGSFPIDPMTQMTPTHFLATPGLWIGLILAAVFLAATIRLRRYRSPS